MEDLDRIDREIDIDASAERVWDLVARPGWYINQGTVVSNPVLETDGDVTVLHHPSTGTGGSAPSPSTRRGTRPTGGWVRTSRRR